MRRWRERVEGSSRIDGRWYAPLLRPVLGSVTRALHDVAPEQDPWALPRTGLGGAMVIHVARGFGLRGWRRAERAAITALEGYNHRVHVGEPSPQERAQWLERDLRWARTAWQKLLETEEPTVSRVVDRLFGKDAEVCDALIPEAVLFLRCAVAAGVVVGDVPENVHRHLDRHVTWLGLSWEAHRGTLDEAGWHGALQAIELSEPYPEEPAAVAHARALASLERLPPGEPTGLLRGALALPPTDAPMRRHPRAWTPLKAPVIAPRTVTAPKLNGAFRTFGARWSGSVEEALEELTESRSHTLTRATEYLRQQGGKRIRPLVALAAAETCGGEAQRALPLAAAVEWLHQGTLVLDDIIDSADVRRGHAPLHRATSDVFATGIAVFVFARVLRCTQGVHPEIRRHLVGAATALAEGERLELRHTGDGELSLTRYYKIIEAKTARLFGCAAAVGALSVEAPAKQVRALSRFGREIGLAFQIIDDVLDYGGDEAVFGKRPGTDLDAAKMTLPLMLLRDELEGSVRERLLAALGHGQEFGWVREQLRAREVLAACRERAAVHRGRALEALAPLPESPGRATLEALAHELGERRC